MSINYDGDDEVEDGDDDDDNDDGDDFDDDGFLYSASFMPMLAVYSTLF